MESLLHDTLTRLTSDKETVLEIDGWSWSLRSASIKDTFLSDLLPSEGNKAVVLIEKRDLLEREDQDYSTYQNGDVSLDPVEENGNSTMSSDTSLSIGMQGLARESGLIPVEDARTILSMYTMLHSPLVKANNNLSPQQPYLPLWVMCDGQDPERTALIGCEPVQTGSNQDANSLTSFVVTTVTCEGVIMKHSEVPTVHKVICEGHGESTTKGISTHGYALYEVVSPVSADSTMTESMDSSYAALECTWNNVEKVLESPHDASHKVLLRAVPGAMWNKPLAVFKELCTLEMFAESLETQEMIFKAGEKVTSISDLITSFLEDVKTGPTFRRKDTSDADSADSQTSWESSFGRSDLDFTERLWVILMTNATCYDDIRTGFSLVISELNKGQIQPMLHSGNKTTLAREIRTLYRDPAHTLSPDLNLVKSLVEIGIDKLQRDYANFFLDQKLTTLHLLEWYVPAVDLLPPSDLVTRLHSLHCILEISMLAYQSLKLPMNNIYVLIRTALEYYKNNSPKVQHTFKLPVEQTSVLHSYKTGPPCVWRLTSSRSGGKKDKDSSVYQLSSRPLLDIFLSASPDQTLDDKGDQDSLQYYVTHVKRDLT